MRHSFPAVLAALALSFTLCACGGQASTPSSSTVGDTGPAQTQDPTETQEPAQMQDPAPTAPGQLEPDSEESQSEAPPEAPENTETPPPTGPEQEPPAAPPEQPAHEPEQPTPVSEPEPEQPVLEPETGTQPADGIYTVSVTLEGGSGRATIESPAKLRCENGALWATIVWSSSNYDYMKVNGEQYDNQNAGGNSTFEIPVAALDEKLPVAADTVAMSEPHEIEYTLYFDASSLQAA